QGLHAHRLLPLGNRRHPGAGVRARTRRLLGRSAAQTQPESVGHLMATHTYDAIVVGSGMSGGWAAKELCEKGLKTLVLERGRNLRHITDYSTALKDPWQLPHNNRPTNADRAAQPVQSTLYL